MINCIFLILLFIIKIRYPRGKSVIDDLLKLTTVLHCTTILSSLSLSLKNYIHTQD